MDAEIARFEAALDKTEQDLLALKSSVQEGIGFRESDIFTAQALVLRDPAIKQKVSAVVREEQVNAEAALSQVVERYTNAFDSVVDPYLRVLEALLQEGGAECTEIPDGSIVVAGELLPSVTARLELNQVRGFVTERGGKFSHSSILARSMGTPAVAGVAEAPQVIKTGDAVIVDGVSGLVFVNPEASVQTEYERLDGEFRAYKNGLQQIVGLPSVTADGTSIALLAKREQVRRHRSGAPLPGRRRRTLPNRVRLLNSLGFPHRRRAVRVPQTRGRASSSQAYHFASARHRRR